MVGDPEMPCGQTRIRGDTDEIQPHNSLCRCDDCLTGAPSQSTIHNAVYSLRSAMQLGDFNFRNVGNFGCQITA